MFLGQASAPAAVQPTYEVVSVRLHKETSNQSHWWAPTADGYTAVSVSIGQLISTAYGLKCSDQLVGLPSWTREDTYDIKAKMAENAVAAFQKLSNREQWEQAALMLRPLLGERFKLAVHHETRELPVYALVIAKSGFKLKPSEAPESPGGMVTNWGLIEIQGGPIGARFIAGLSDAVGRIVIDKTGIMGNYDITLRWTPDEPSGDDDTGPSIFTALEEQLGLKLVRETSPVDVLVVDHVEKPSDN